MLRHCSVSFLLALGTKSTGKQSAPGGPFHVCGPRAAAHQAGGTRQGVCSSLSLDPSGPSIHYLLSIAYAGLLSTSHMVLVRQGVRGNNTAPPACTLLGLGASLCCWGLAPLQLLTSGVSGAWHNFGENNLLPVCLCRGGRGETPGVQMKMKGRGEEHMYSFVYFSEQPQVAVGLGARGYRRPQLSEH